MKISTSAVFCLFCLALVTGSRTGSGANTRTQKDDTKDLCRALKKLFVEHCTVPMINYVYGADICNNSTVSSFFD